jgi:hypothetical protein
MKRFLNYTWCWLFCWVWLLLSIVARAQTVPASYPYPRPFPTNGSTPLTHIRPTAVLSKSDYSDPRSVVWDVMTGGGMRPVGTMAERDSINPNQRKQGMFVYTCDNLKLWTLNSDLLTWTEFVGSGSNQTYRGNAENIGAYWSVPGVIPAYDGSGPYPDKTIALIEFSGAAQGGDFLSLGGGPSGAVLDQNGDPILAGQWAPGIPTMLIYDASSLFWVLVSPSALPPVSSGGSVTNGIYRGSASNVGANWTVASVDPAYATADPYPARSLALVTFSAGAQGVDFLKLGAGPSAPVLDQNGNPVPAGSWAPGIPTAFVYEDTSLAWVLLSPSAIAPSGGGGGGGTNESNIYSRDGTITNNRIVLQAGNLTWLATNTAGKFAIDSKGTVVIGSANPNVAQIGLTNGVVGIGAKTRFDLRTPAVETWALGHSNRPPPGMVPTLVDEATGSLEYKAFAYRATVFRISAGVLEATVANTFPQLRGTNIENGTMLVAYFVAGGGGFVFNSGNDTLKVGNLPAKGIWSPQLVAIGPGEIKYGTSGVLVYTADYDKWIYQSQSAQASIYAQDGTFSGVRTVNNPSGFNIAGTGPLDFRSSGPVTILSSRPNSGFLSLDMNVTGLYGYATILSGSAEVSISSPSVVIAGTTSFNLVTPRKNSNLAMVGEALLLKTGGTVDYEALMYRGDSFDSSGTGNAFRLRATSHIGVNTCFPIYTGSTVPPDGLLVHTKFIRSGNNLVLTPVIGANPTFALGDSGASYPIYLNTGLQPASGEIKVNGVYLLTFNAQPTARWRVVGDLGGGGGGGSPGPAGADGKSVLNGSGVPGAGTGVDGDFYINTAANSIYGPKSGGVWGSGTSLIGPTGATGPTGSTGPAGTAATIGVGSTFALPQGASPGVTNVGTSSAAMLNFGIPVPITPTGTGFAHVTGGVSDAASLSYFDGLDKMFTKVRWGAASGTTVDGTSILFANGHNILVSSGTITAGSAPGYHGGISLNATATSTSAALLVSSRSSATAALGTFEIGAGKMLVSANVIVPVLSDVTNPFLIIVGFGSSHLSAASAVRIQYTSVNSPNWQFVAISNSVPTIVTTSIPVVAGSPYDIRVLVSGNGSISEAFINGSSVGSFTSGMPFGSAQRVAAMGGIQRTSSGAATRSILFTRLHYMAEQN